MTFFLFVNNQELYPITNARDILKLPISGNDASVYSN